MPRACSVCSHPDRERVELGLVTGRPKRRIAAEAGLSESAIHRHDAEHLPGAVLAAHDAREAARADRLLSATLERESDALRLMAKAESEGDVRAAVVALREARECLALRARIGERLLHDETAPATFADLIRALDDRAERLGEGASNPWCSPGE